jgi:hypothetical protein
MRYFLAVETKLADPFCKTQTKYKFKYSLSRLRNWNMPNVGIDTVTVSRKLCRPVSMIQSREPDVRLTPRSITHWMSLPQRRRGKPATLPVWRASRDPHGTVLLLHLVGLLDFHYHMQILQTRFMNFIYSVPHTSHCNRSWTRNRYLPSWVSKQNWTHNQSKAVPLHAMAALGGRGAIASTHSWPRH